jgi:dihydroorotate dehydrogenase
MSISEKLAKLDKVMRPVLESFSPKFYIDVYSRGRRDFLSRLSDDEPLNIDIDRWIHPVKVWDIEFNNNLFNAAGMFKSGKGYQMTALEGAGAWLAGTSTSLPRAGNSKLNILHPFLPLPNSKSAVNWLGLPNDGHFALASKIIKISKVKGCPIGVSVSSDPSESGLQALKSLVEGITVLSNSGADFIELNESCPNVSGHGKNSNNELDTNMLERLEYIKNNILKKRTKNLPVIVKYSVDTDLELLKKLIPVLVDYGFDGINLGNTSTTYNEYLPKFNQKEKKIFEYFISNFGGGVSGNLIKEKSLLLCAETSKILNSINLKKEFNIIRTGGIDSYQDLIESGNAGVTLNQWYTGYFENFTNYGHNLYKELYMRK